MTDSVVVPKEPTPEMLKAGIKEYLSAYSNEDDPEDVVKAIFQAMVAAAPASEPVAWMHEWQGINNLGMPGGTAMVSLCWTQEWDGQTGGREPYKVTPLYAAPQGGK